jgi:hypothetical protein
LPEKVRATWREAVVALILVGGLGEARFVILCVCVCVCLGFRKREKEGEKRTEREKYVETGK